MAIGVTLVERSTARVYDDDAPQCAIERWRVREAVDPALEPALGRQGEDDRQRERQHDGRGYQETAEHGIIQSNSMSGTRSGTDTALRRNLPATSRPVKPRAWRRSIAPVPRWLLVSVLMSAASAAAARAQGAEARGPVVRSLSFRGNHAIDDYTLSISIATSRSSFFQRSPLLRWTGLGERKYLTEGEFRRDVLRIEALYRQSGFVDATVDTVVRRPDGDVYITFVIHEGEPIRVDSITVHGLGEILSERDVIRHFPLQVGDPFNRLLMQASADSVRWWLANRGYPFAQVYRNFDTDRQARTARIDFEVDPGGRARVAAVDVEGARHISEGVIRRAIPVQPGDWYSQRDLYTSQLDLYRMEVFDYVHVGLENDSARSNDTLVTVRVRLTEGPFRRLRIGAGYGTIDCFRALSAWDLHNVFGGGRTLRLNGRLSQIGAGAPLGLGFENTVCPALAREDTSRLKLNYNLTASLAEPHLFTRRATGSISLYAERYTEYQAYLRTTVGGDLSATYRTGLGIPVTFSYGLAYGSTKAEPATFCSYLNVCQLDDISVFTRSIIRAVAGVSAVRDRRNSVLDPSHGSRAALELRYAAPAIGSDTLSQFTKATAELSAHYPVGRQRVVSWRIKAGAILSSNISTTGQELRYVPTEERFYAGGANTVRGFGQNELGPLVRVLDTVIVREQTQNGQTVMVPDSVVRTSATGGNTLLLANIEYRFPLPVGGPKVSGAVYVDAGRVWNRGSADVAIGGIRVTPGMGVRYASPLGPIRLDVAFNPYSAPTSRLYVRQGNQLDVADPAYQPSVGFLGRFRIHFSVGEPF